ncbi:MAG TPA: DUF4136 domain-containing protein [Enhygromyxa sp.]|nr:DUF4136 domain-containing protein [Enhygromyxa sp.]
MIRSRSVLLGATLGAGLLLGACKDDEQQDEQSSYEAKIEVEVNPDVDFSQYTSFDVVNPAPNAAGDPPPQFIDFQLEVEDAIAAELSAKGLTRDRNSPQLLVNPMVSLEPASSAAQFYESYYGWYWGYEALWAFNYDYTEGSLVIDVVDRGNPDDLGDDVLVYRGAAYGLMAQDREVIQLQLRNATQAIFAEWPTTAPTEPR